MPLVINNNMTHLGTSGTSGNSGTNGTTASRNGTNGGGGTDGQDIAQTVSGRIFTGTTDGDTVNFSRTSTAGSGAGGGFGGSGAASVATVNTSSGPNFSQTDVFYDGAGLAGQGGLAGQAGNAAARYTNLTFNLGTSAGSQDSIRLFADANGAQGGAGGAGGGGGSSGTTLNDTSTTIGPPPFTTIYSQLGGPGQHGASGQNGAAGGAARALFTTLNVTADSVSVTIGGTADGFAGGGGGSGGSGGSGVNGGLGGHGGAGGDGGNGTAGLTALTLTATGLLNLVATMAATGGGGANGGSGNNGGFGTTTTITSNCGGSSGTTNTTYAASGAGGSGGDGGDGNAFMRSSVITGSIGNDNAYVTLASYGGLGGTGAFGGAGTASSSSTSGTTVTTVTGTPQGTRGPDGNAGNTLTEMRNVTFNLGGGDDRLTISLLAAGPGTNSVVFSGNRFDGGAGDNDRLSLGIGLAGEQYAVVNVATGTLSMGSGTGNTFSGFEDFRGTSGNDRFVDGAGEQHYTGSFGSDTFAFRAATSALPGTDRIDDFNTEDVISLRGFGSSFNSFAEVMLKTQQTSSGAQIETPSGSFILLYFVEMASLQANDFTF